MGWEFQWQRVDAIIQQHPQTLFLPVILVCSRDTCMARIRRRYEARPEYYDPPEVYVTEPKNIRIWDYLAQLDRPAVRFVNAEGSFIQVYGKVRECVWGQLDGSWG
jgi:hypothetical protein